MADTLGEMLVRVGGRKQKFTDTMPCPGDNTAECTDRG